MIWLSVFAGLVFAVIALALGAPVCVHRRRLVVERTQAVWFLFALMQPLNGAVFALDGILIGASDEAVSRLVDGRRVRRVRNRLLAAIAFDWGIVGVWAALVVLIVVRLSLMGWRFAGRRWLVTGWA